MRLIAFLFLAAFALAGIVRYSKAAAPAPGVAAQRAQAARPLALVDPAQGALPSAAQIAPAPLVLRHKHRFARAALRAIQKAAAQDKSKPKPPAQMAKVAKARR